jgi:UDP-N-acetylglucosamine--N-acetylmuramyl-(pentapeptide) pyrophosphoryl-undecaprenol N-acetylglucosamine transferase
MKKILLTGGGTAGHVTPNIALIPVFRKSGWDITYIGSYEGIEKGLIEKCNVPYFGIASGKLRRYFSWKNFSDAFNVLKGIGEAKKILEKEKPDIVFSKGGFVSVPVVRASKKLKIPVVIHESDMTPGLANRLSFSAATKILCNFPETMRYLPKDKAIFTGTPIREELFRGDAEKGRQFCHFNDKKPIILVVGGSTGAKAVNDAVRNLLPTLLERFQVAHLCGKGKTDMKYNHTVGYEQYEYISAELADMLACADIVISRAGANAICELLALRKPSILIPLSAKASRGDQILNAESFERQGFSYVIHEEDLTNETLLEGVNRVYKRRTEYIAAMQNAKQLNAAQSIYSIINDIVK